MPQSASLLRHSDDLNSWNPEAFKTLRIKGQRVGYVKHGFADVLENVSELFVVTDQQVTLVNDDWSFAECSARLEQFSHWAVAQGHIHQFMGEPYPVTAGGREQAVATMDRASAVYFGLRTFGQHINGYVRSDEGLKLWVARRAADRVYFPNKLDNIVAGGLPYHLSLSENLQKECAEEANIQADLAGQAIPVGAVTYCRETEKGLKPDTLYCYDLELPADFQPLNTDGEVSEFMLVAAEEVLQWVRETDEFKTNCNLVFIDFFIRHGVIGPEDAEYLRLLSGLHHP